MRTAAEEFELVRQARDLLHQVAGERRSEATERQYARAWSRLRDDGRPLGEIAGTKRTLYAYRAAVRWGVAAELAGLLRERDKAQRAGDSEARAELADKIAGHLERVQAVSAERWTGGRQRGPNAKRQLLGKLPPDWRERMLAASGGSTYAAELAVLAATGCRPEELCKGVRIENRPEGVSVLIEGAKVTEGTGQPARRLVLDPGASEAARRLSELAEGGPVEIGHGRTPGGLREAVRRVGRRALGRDDVTPYAFRHALSADLKAEGHAPEQIAAAMGHVSDRSQSHYGTYQQGGGSTGLRSATAARQVRTHDQGLERVANRTWERSEPTRAPAPSFGYER